tara:strand:- start:176 stop:730 length:555 start_codon:yes stop_codon:yes gene_type:complete
MIIIPSVKNHQEAKQMATNKAFNGKTMLEKGSGQYAGNLAELVFKDILDIKRLEHDYTASTSYHFDFKIGKATIDLKAKQRTVDCRPDYDTHVNLYQKDYPCHYYVFASVLIPKGEELASKVQFMGWCRKSDYWSTCQIKRKGQNSDGLIEREDGGKKKYNELETMDSLFNNIETHLYQLTFGE